MEAEFIPYEIALELKELGFDEPCFATYRTHAVGSKKPFEYDLDYHTKVEMSSNVIPINSEYTEESKWISAPTYSQAFKWFREKYKPEEINFYIHLLDTHSTPKKYLPCYTIRRGVDVIEVKTSNTYEEAELECLRKLIEIVKEQK